MKRNIEYKCAIVVKLIPGQLLVISTATRLGANYQVVKLEPVRLSNFPGDKIEQGHPTSFLLVPTAAIPMVFRW